MPCGFYTDVAAINGECGVLVAEFIEFMEKTHRFDPEVIGELTKLQNRDCDAFMRGHYETYPQDDYVNHRMFMDAHSYLPDQILPLTDRMSMAVSLEARVPLLARRIIEFSFSLNETIRYHNDELKGLLKHAYRDILPDNILDRRKKGFGIPRSYLGDLGGGKIIQENVLRQLYLC